MGPSPRLLGIAVTAFATMLVVCAPNEAAAQSCGELGGTYCSPSGSCPAGYESVGNTGDPCTPCCRPETQGPSCGEMGGDWCSQSGSCPSGYSSLGNSGDGCHPCCKRDPVGPSCGEMGGDWCSDNGSCPSGYHSLGNSGDNCRPCCKQDAPPACNNNGSCGGAETCGNCPGDCDPRPTLSASKTTAAVGEAIVFTPHNVDDAAPAWDLGNGVHLNGRPLTYAYPATGNYQVVLTGSDNRCGTTQDSAPVTIHIVAAPPPACNNNGACDGAETCGGCPADCDPRPTMSASKTTAAVGEPIVFTPQKVDDASPDWDLGNSVHLNGRPLTYAYPAMGTYHVVLTGSDNRCGTTQDSLPVAIHIVAAPPPECNNNGACDGAETCGTCPADCDPRPTLTASKTTAAVGEAIVFTPHKVDDASPAWDLGNGVHQNGRPLTYAYPAVGTYQVVLTGSDNACGTTQDSLPVAIHIVAGPPPACNSNGACDGAETCASCPSDCDPRPTLSASRTTAAVGEPIVFTPQKVDDAAPAWDLGNGDHRNGRPLTYAYSAVGTYQVVLTGTDNACGTTQDSLPVAIHIVTAPPPACHNNNVCEAEETCSGCPFDCDPNPAFTVSTRTAAIGQPITFTPSRVDDAEPSWDLGNGEHRLGRPLVYAYQAAGRYRVVLTGTDDRCGTTQDSDPIEVVVAGTPVTCDRDGTCEPENGENCGTCVDDCAAEPAFVQSSGGVFAGVPITFSADRSTVLNPPPPQWDMGDTHHLIGDPVTYTYDRPGTYNVILTASEPKCEKTRDSRPRQIVVQAPEDCDPIIPGLCCNNGHCDQYEDSLCPADCTGGPGVDYAAQVVMTPDVPTRLACGESYNGSITMRNVGGLPWTREAAIRLGAVGNHNDLGEALRVEVPENLVVMTNDIVTFPVVFTAPTAPGHYSVDWQMLKEYVLWFGPAVNVEVEVSSSSPDCRPDDVGSSDDDDPRKIDVKLFDGSTVRVINESSASNARIIQLVNAADWSTKGDCSTNEGKGLMKGNDATSNADRIYVNDEYLLWFDFTETDGLPNALGAATWVRSGALTGWWPLTGNGDGLNFRNPRPNCHGLALNVLLPGSAGMPGTFHWDKFAPPTENSINVLLAAGGTKADLRPMSYHYSARLSSSNFRLDPTLPLGTRNEEGTHYLTHGRLVGASGFTNPDGTKNCPDFFINPYDCKNDSTTNSIDSRLDYVAKNEKVTVRWWFKLPKETKMLNVYWGLWTGYSHNEDGKPNCDVYKDNVRQWPDVSPPVSQTYTVDFSNGRVATIGPEDCGFTTDAQLVCNGEGLNGAYCNAQEALERPAVGDWLRLDGPRGAMRTTIEPSDVRVDYVAAYDETADGEMGIIAGRVGDFANPVVLPAGEYTMNYSITSRGPTALSNGPFTGAVGEVLLFDGSASYANGSGVLNRWHWNFGDGGSAEGPTVTHAYAQPGTYDVHLTVTDDNARIATGQTTSRIGLPPNLAPIADAGGPYQGRVAESVTFDATSSQDDEPASLAYLWDFGDGVHAMGPAPTHAYAQSGTHNAKLTVVDRMGARAESTAAVTVRVPNRAPSVVITGPRTCAVPCSLPLTASVDDPDGDPVTLTWQGCASGQAATAECTFTAVGDAQARGVAPDESGAAGSAVYEVVATAHVNRAPTVTEAATGTCAGNSCTVTFAATAADADGDPLTYSWSGCASGTAASVQCARSGEGSLTAGVAVADPGGLSASTSATATVYAAGYAASAWSACTFTQAYVCTAQGPTGCSRQGQQTRTVDATSWTLDPSQAVSAPPASQACTQTAPGYIAAYSVTYDANWTCTGTGATGCRKNRLAYSPSSYGPISPDAAVPAAIIYTTGYVASWHVGPWSGCNASCGGGVQRRQVYANGWKATPPSVGRPADEQGCNNNPCPRTCYDYGLYRTWSECYGDGWSYCDTRYRDDGIGGLLTCRHGYN